MTAPSDIDTLTELHDEFFIDSAYLILLGRPGDPNGREYFLDQLRQGMSKREIIARIAGSPEGRRYQERAPLPGLPRLLRQQRRKRLSPMNWLGSRRQTQRQINRLENELGRMVTRLAELESGLAQGAYPAHPRQPRPRVMAQASGTAVSRPVLGRHGQHILSRLMG